MKSVSISGSLRENVGKKDARAQRAKGMIPCVIYGGKEQRMFVVEEKQFRQLLYTPEVKYAKITIDGNMTKAIVQATQFHPITDKLLHVDFLEIVDEKPVTIAIPVKYSGTAPGVLKGGFLYRRARKLKVNGLLENIPEFISADVSTMEIDDAIRVEDLAMDNLTFMEEPNKIVANVVPTRNVVEETAAEGTGEAEGEGKDEAAPASES